MVETKAELVCLSCSRRLGVVETTGERKLQLSPNATLPETVRIVGRQLRCGRCGGSVMLEDLQELYAAA
ncbi:MAG TPA: hypothetical protein VNM43_02045 [Dehalococcoidia bacterium]|jgi:DNA-directed RNA polymerase subunit RPC12/RpoP|nr:hypothetical protein [Dehalococcoidia bacterium]HXF50445.1 hypothetical protein [Dehalococcoidia bacterium]